MESQTKPTTNQHEDSPNNTGQQIKAHLCMFVACAMWGLMAPVAKDAIVNGGMTGITMATFRMVGGAICFWIASLFTRSQEVCPKDMLRFFFASMLSIVLNQGCFTVGVSITSPINASIVTTALPVITLVLAAIFLKEPITGKKLMGVVAGVAGAFILIMGSARAAMGQQGNIMGDLLCLSSQLCFAIYLTLFKDLIQKYDIITCEKWMFTYATIVFLPLTTNQVMTLPWQTFTPLTLAETAFVVLGGTFLAYILVVQGQKTLRPTVVSMYNYVQPVMATALSVAIGVGVFGLTQAAAVVLIFSGVWMVTHSKSRADLLKEGKAEEA